LDSLISAVSIIKPNDSWNGNNFSIAQIFAIECSLYFCTKAYRSSITAGVLTEEVLGSWEQRVPGSYSPTYDIDPSTLDEYETVNNHSLCGPHYGGFNRSDLQLQIPRDQADQVGLPRHANLVFNITQRASCSSTFGVDRQVFQAGTILWPGDNNQSALSALAAAVLKSARNEDIPMVFSNIANSLSTWICDSSNTLQTGDQQEWIIHIQVQWIYLILPIFTMACGLCFLLFSILETATIHLPAWKADVLPSLAHALDPNARHQLRLAIGNDDAKKASQAGVLGQLEKSKDGFELKPKYPSGRT
jgi:hypothetical protein